MTEPKKEGTPHFTKKYVYFFGDGKAEGTRDQRTLLGGKGANLAEMTNLGIPVPAGFTITTETCDLYNKSGKKWPAGLEAQVKANIARLEETMGAKFGDRNNPLLVSVRSGAAASMPAMIDTVFNLGLNCEVAQGLIIRIENERRACVTNCGFITMFSHDGKKLTYSSNRNNSPNSRDTNLFIADWVD